MGPRPTLETCLYDVTSRAVSEHQTTNLGVRSSNLFGRANNPLILIQNFCATFCPLTKPARGQHRGNTRTVLPFCVSLTVAA